MVYLSRDPRLDPLRLNPLFTDLLRRMGLDDQAPVRSAR
jgi:hypothetical protein